MVHLHGEHGNDSRLFMLVLLLTDTKQFNMILFMVYTAMRVIYIPCLNKQRYSPQYFWY